MTYDSVYVQCFILIFILIASWNTQYLTCHMFSFPHKKKNCSAAHTYFGGKWNSVSCKITVEMMILFQRWLLHMSISILWIDFHGLAFYRFAGIWLKLELGWHFRHWLFFAYSMHWGRRWDGKDLTQLWHWFRASML